MGVSFTPTPAFPPQGGGSVCGGSSDLKSPFPSWERVRVRGTIVVLKPYAPLPAWQFIDSTEMGWWWVFLSPPPQPSPLKGEGVLGRSLKGVFGVSLRSHPEGVSPKDPDRSADPTAAAASQI